MSTLLSEIESVAGVGPAELTAAGTPAELEQWRIRWLGTKGRLAELFEKMKAVPGPEKREVGRRLNELKSAWTAAFEARQAAAGSAAAPGPAFDWTLPTVAPIVGRSHILTRVRREIADIFERMGFEQIHSREIEDDFHNFVALNIPADHPARDPRDNFVLDAARLLRTQTSTAQVRVMETRSPPLRIIHAGRVYRPDVEDRTHADMFHQIEALYVDRGVTMAHLKRCIELFARTYFAAEVSTRFRPSFFPFTEPSAEVDITCPACGGTGRRGANKAESTPCPTCKASGWIEMGGCGMVDPNVFAAVGIDAELYTGFAFGLGIERIAMRKYGVPDIRLFAGRDFEHELEAASSSSAQAAPHKVRWFGNDLRFLGQF